MSVQNSSTHQLKVTLKGVKPPVWRRITVSSNITMKRLHNILQITMGWENYHLHGFESNDQEYGDPENAMFNEIKDERQIKLAQVAPTVGTEITYTYDFGDRWEHSIVVEKIVPNMLNRQTPVCIGGKSACPPEDCGGIWGYAELRQAINDPTHLENTRWSEWLKECFDIDTFDPNTFDPELVNQRLHPQRKVTVQSSTLNH
jgi:hypothetical protein